MMYSGNVCLDMMVGVDGTVSQLQVLHAVGLGLDEEAVAAAGQWLFSPAMRDGKPVATELPISIVFQIF